MSTTPIVLLAPAPAMTFVAMPSGVTYVSDANGLVLTTMVADQLALVAAGCTALSPNPGGIARAETGIAYTLSNTDNANALIFTNAAPVTVTLPAASPVGFAVTLYQGGAGPVTAIAAGSASVATPNVATTPGPYCALYCIVIANPGAAAQWAVIAEPSQTGGGVVGAATLANLYAQDNAAHCAQYTVAQVFSDTTTANNGYWLKTGTGNGAGQWTQQSTITPQSVAAAIANETTRAMGAEGCLAAQMPPVYFLWPDDAWQFSSGTFDANGYPVDALNAWNQPVGATPDMFVRTTFLWPDEPLAAALLAGQVPTVDAGGNVVAPYDPTVGAAVAAQLPPLVAGTLSPVYATLNGLVPYLWPDDATAFSGGCFDANGYPVFALDPWGRAVGTEAEQFVRLTFLWSDDPFSAALTPGQMVTVDAGGNVVVPYTTIPTNQYSVAAWAPYITSGGGVAITSNAAATAGADIFVASSRGVIRGAPAVQPGSPTILRWMDDATASGNQPYHENRWIDFSGVDYIKALGGITKIVTVIDIGHSLTVGAIATTLLTTAPFFTRCVMYNGGPKVYQNEGSGWSYPAPICDDAQIRCLAEYYEFQSANGQGETHGGGVGYWFSQSTNLALTEVVLPTSVGAGGSTLAEWLAGTTQFSNLLRVLERSAAHAAFLEIAWEPYVTCSIGENDYVTYQANASGFQSNLIALQSAIQTAVQNIYMANSWTVPIYIPLIMIQPSSWTSSNYNSGNGYDTCAVAYVFPALARTYPHLFKLVGPGYYTGNYASGTPPQKIHKTALGYKLDGQYNARTVQKIRAAAATPGLYVTGVSNSGSTLTIATNATSNLAIDTSVVSDPGQCGLRVLDVTAGNTNIGLSGIAVSGGTITATLASHVAGNTMMLGVGDYGVAPNDAGPTTGPRTTVRDSSSDVSSPDTNSTPMYNYLCHDQITWTAAS